MAFEVHIIRDQFPILKRAVDGNPLVYLDNAATTQKPRCVIDAMTNFYEHNNANIKRGMHPLAEDATELYEAARESVQRFINAKSAHEVIFTHGTTESINLVARSYGEAFLKKGDVILLSVLEHHSNIVPWLALKDRIGIEIEWIGIEKDGTLKMDEADAIIASGKVKLLSITCVSNVLGVRTDYVKLCKLVHTHGGKVFLDAAQLASHASIDVKEIDCDFLAFSGHKVYGPTGIGILYGKEEWLNGMSPFLGGGGMIREVYRDRFTPNHLPDKFEAGTPAIAEAHGLKVALEWLSDIGFDAIQRHENEILTHALETLSQLPFIEILGPKDPSKIMGCLSFVSSPLTACLPDKQAHHSQLVHPHDFTEFLGRNGICLRAGHHCCQPLHDLLGQSATTRLSVALYNTKEEIDYTSQSLEDSWSFFQHQ